MPTPQQIDFDPSIDYYKALGVGEKATADEIKRAFGEYCVEVRSGAFPGPEHVYRMVEGEAEKLDELEREFWPD